VLIPAIAGDVPDSGGRRKDAVYSLRRTRLSPIWVLVVALILAVFAASQMAQTRAAPTGMVAAFVDVNGNDIDDTCEDPATVTPDEAAAAEAEDAVDLNDDNTISVSEAAQSERIGGTNCNHGGYVSWVAHGSCPDPVEEPVTEPGTEPVTGPALDAALVTTELCDEEPAEEPTDEAVTPATECDEVPPPERDPAFDEQKNGHGKWVSKVAGSDAMGGKNCNHGGAVSAAAKKDHEAAAAARDAAKAEKAAARAEKKAAREAAKLASEHGKGKGKGKNH
jgi:hypothetical protein